MRKIFRNKDAKQKIMGVVIALVFIVMVTTPFFMGSNSRVKAADSWWDTDFTYYKNITISNAVNDYEMLINVTHTSGGDVNCSGNCNNDFSDLRFVDIDNSNELDYWVENKVDGSFANVWVELPSDVETDNAIHMYYGNAIASSMSDGYDTFLYFSDFTSQQNVSDWVYKGTPNGYDVVSLNLTNVSLSANDIGPERRLRWNTNISQWNTLTSGSIIWLATQDRDTDIRDQDSIELVINTDNDNTGVSDSDIGFKQAIKEAGDLYGAYSGDVTYPDCNGFHVWEMVSTTSKAVGTFWDEADTTAYLSQTVSETTPSNADLTNIVFLFGRGTGTYTFEWRDSDYLYVYSNRQAGTEVGFYIDYMFYSLYEDTEPSVNTIGEENSGSEGDYSINGLDGDTRFTHSGEAGDTNTSLLVMNIYTNTSGSSDNCTDIFLDFSGGYPSGFVASNFSFQVRNATDGTFSTNWNTVTGNMTLNTTTWAENWAYGTNPFPIVNYNSTIEVRMRVSIPSSATVGTNTTDAWNVVWKILT